MRLRARLEGAHLGPSTSRDIAISAVCVVRKVSFLMSLGVSVHLFPKWTTNMVVVESTLPGGSFIRASK